MNKRVLIISYWFEPFQAVGTNRIVGFAKYLQEMGWEVGVVTVKDSLLAYDGLRYNSGLEINSLNICRTAGFSLSTFLRKLSFGKLKGGGQTRKEFAKSKKFSLKRKLFEFYENNFVYPDECWPWFWLGRNKALKFTKKFSPDIILSCAMPGTAHRISAYINNKTQIPWCADYRDLWSLNHDRVLKPKIKSKLIELEKKLLTTCSLATTVSQGLRNNLSKLTSSPVEVIMNGYDDVVCPYYQVSKNLKIVYTGTYYHEKQNVLPLLDNLKELVEKKIMNSDSFELVFCGNNTDFIESLVPENIKSSCIFLGLVSKDEVIKIQASADILLFLKYPGSGILTGKIFEYISWKKPILALGEPEKEIDTILKSVNADICEGEQAIQDKLIQWTEEKLLEGNVNFTSKNTESYSIKKQVETLHYLLINKLEERRKFKNTCK
ncbi:MAG: glycosyltransferase [Lentisphaeraceae bacterium]|nr:glycosyltransferase [Lentisphaeraceae bacterium]